MGRGSKAQLQVSKNLNGIAFKVNILMCSENSPYKYRSLYSQSSGYAPEIYFPLVVCYTNCNRIAYLSDIAKAKTRRPHSFFVWDKARGVLLT